eukprot:3053270-Rhodomonas_salina.1
MANKIPRGQTGSGPPWSLCGQVVTRSLESAVGKANQEINSNRRYSLERVSQNLQILRTSTV